MVVEISCPGSRMVASVLFSSAKAKFGRQTDPAIEARPLLEVEVTKQTRLSFQRMPSLVLRRAGMDKGNSVGFRRLSVK